MNELDGLLEGRPTRRKALATLSLAASMGVAGCSSQESTEPEGKPEPEPEPQPEPEPDQQEEENQYDDFNPEEISLIEFAERASADVYPLMFSAYDPHKLDEEYRQKLGDDWDEHNIFEPGVGFPFEVGFDKTDNPVALFQAAADFELEGALNIRAGQLPAEHPRERVVQTLLDADNELLSDSEDWDIVSDGEIAQVVNDEMMATIWSSGLTEPQKYLGELEKYAENYGVEHFSPEVDELAERLDGEDLFTVHLSEFEKYFPLSRENVQPEGAVLRGDMGEGVDTAWFFKHENVAEASAEEAQELASNEESVLNPPVEHESNYVIAPGDQRSIEYTLNDSVTVGTRTIGYTVLG